MIRLIVADVDGVLSSGEAAPFDFAVLQRLAEVNDRARHEPQHPAVTLCTGRPAPYVEVLMQAIHGFYPAIYEHGAGLYMPEPYGFKAHPALTPVMQHNSWHSTPGSTTHSSPPTWRTFSQANRPHSVYLHVPASPYMKWRIRLSAWHVSGTTRFSSRRGLRV
jgi:hypothetical protein